MNNLESRIQKSFIKHCRDRAKYDPLWDWIFAIPNGGKRDVVTASIQKAEGVLSGVADVFVPLPRKIQDTTGHCVVVWFGLWIEFKSPTGKQSVSQKLFQRHMEVRGYKYAICRSASEAIDEVEKYFD